MRLIVRGPTDFDDYQFVKRVLNRYTRPAKDVVLISDIRPGYDYHITPSSFPLAERWLRDRWVRSVQVFENDPKLFSWTVRHYAPFKGNKQYREGVKVKRLNMARDATHLVLFWDAGDVDEETEAMAELGTLFGLQTKRVLV